MKLYIKQRVFTIGSKFDVWDEAGNTRYSVQGEVFTLGRKLHIFDASGMEVAFVKQRLLTFLPKFEVYVGEQFVATIEKELTLFHPTYHIVGTDWVVDGDVFAHDYSILSGGNCIAAIHKKWMSWGDSFEIDYAGGVDECMLLAVILAIDTVMDNSGSGSHSSS